MMDRTDVCETTKTRKDALSFYYWDRQLNSSIHRMLNMSSRLKKQACDMQLNKIFPINFSFYLN